MIFFKIKDYKKTNYASEEVLSNMGIFLYFWAYFCIIRWIFELFESFLIIFGGKKWEKFCFF
jgi:hypothetical protein